MCRNLRVAYNRVPAGRVHVGSMCSLAVAGRQQDSLNDESCSYPSTSVPLRIRFSVTRVRHSVLSIANDPLVVSLMVFIEKGKSPTVNRQ